MLGQRSSSFVREHGGGWEKRRKKGSSISPWAVGFTYMPETPARVHSDIHALPDAAEL